ARMVADLACFRGQVARAVRSGQARLRAFQTLLDANHVHDRNAFGDADDERDFSFDGFDDRVGCACWRNIDHGSVGARAFLGFGNGCEDRQLFALGAFPGFATLLRMDTADHLRAVIGKRLFGVESTGLAGQALYENLGVLVDENGHALIPLHCSDDLLRRIVEIVGRNDVQAALVDDLLAKLDIGALETDNQRNLQADFLDCGDHAFSNDVALHDAAEDVDQNALDSRVSGDDLERSRHLLLGGTATNVEEVGRFSTVELDDVHRCHGKASAVDHAADIAVESHVSEVVLGSFDLFFVFFRQIAQFLN